MKKQREFIVSMCMYLACATPVYAAEEESTPFLCAPGEPIQCESDGQCTRVTIQSTRLPRFIRVDFAAQQLSGVAGEEKVVSAVKNRQQLNGMLILQGAENGRGWSMTINEKSNEMTLTVAGDQVGFVVFGACMRLDGEGKE